MTKSKTLLLALLTVILNSCDSSNSNSNDEASIINKWKLNSWKYNNNEQTLTNCDKQRYIQFNINGTFERIDYIIDGSNCIEEGHDNGNYNYNTSEDKITLNFTDELDGPQTEILNNVQLTTTKIIYSWDEDNNGSDEHQLEFLKE